MFYFVSNDRKPNILKKMCCTVIQNKAIQENKITFQCFLPVVTNLIYFITSEREEQMCIHQPTSLSDDMDEALPYFPGRCVAHKSWATAVI